MQKLKGQQNVILIMLTIMEKKNLKASGILATCIQHEIDHLNGVLFVDYLSKLKKNMIIKTYQKKRIRKNYF